MTNKKINQMTDSELQEFATWIKTEIAKEFYGVDHVVDVLLTGYYLSFVRPRMSNVILWGRGGFGKSELVRKFFELIGEAARVFDFSKETTVERLLGGQNLAIWRDEGIEYFNLDLSVFSHSYGIWEEALSAPASVLAMMRNPLASGTFSQNQQVYSVQSKFIVICTNATPSDFQGDRDTAALLERFPYQLMVDWSHLDDSSKSAGYRFICKKIMPTMKSSDAEIFAETAVGEDISPRTLISAISALKFLVKMNPLNSAADALQMMGYVAANADVLRQQRQRIVLDAALNKCTKSISDVTHNVVSMFNSPNKDKVGIPLLQAAQQLLDAAKFEIRNVAESVKADVPDAMDSLTVKLSDINKIEIQLQGIAGKLALGG